MRACHLSILLLLATTACSAAARQPAPSRTEEPRTAEPAPRSSTSEAPTPQPLPGTTQPPKRAEPGERPVAPPERPSSPSERTSPPADRPKAAPELPPERPVNAPGYDPARLGIVKVFPAGTPDGLLREAFRCALESLESVGFDCYARINVESNRDNDIALQQLRNYQWRKFRERAPTYLMGGDKEFAVEVTRRDQGKDETKIFLRSTKRDYPAPITLRRTPEGWQIYVNSL